MRLEIKLETSRPSERESSDISHINYAGGSLSVYTDDLPKLIDRISTVLRENGYTGRIGAGVGGFFAGGPEV